MIQISEWLVIYAIIAFFILCACYLLYFIISRKLFPQVMEFQKEINPKKGSTIITIAGSGIIKRVEMQTSESSSSSIVLTIDKTAYTAFAMLVRPDNLSEENHNEQKHTSLKIEVNLDRLFHREFSLFIDNRSDASLNSTGKIFYEIKKPLIETIRHMV